MKSTPREPRCLRIYRGIGIEVGIARRMTGNSAVELTCAGTPKIGGNKPLATDDY